MTTFLALYAGESSGAAKMVAVTAETEIVRDFAARLLGESEVEADPIALELERGRRRALRLVGGQVDLRRFDARPSRYPGYTSLYDPVEDEWHDFPTKDCYPSIVELANKKRRKGGA